MIYKEFIVKTGNSMEWENVVKHFSNTTDHIFPITLVALVNEKCIGTVSILENDLHIRELYKPWLASLNTKPEYRGRGVGQELVAKTISVVKELGYKEL
ncbi:GNAT family N-acetyltransferase [Ureibacillus sp. Re31]|uniref:GNAT family N-acetyltransferase n=1 Tax=Ureibacillus galli TaxID=2762222 RepID=A0ABR8XAD6_9BACL|nr:GNAT family N-acetyltransferase [Ureibacillus galli]MBD8026284.1 GNAT family N-acetyltransferase [Ureibacillus galli]